MTVLATGGDAGGASKITSDVLNVAAQSMAMIKGMTGIDIAEALKKDRRQLTDGNARSLVEAGAAKPAPSQTPPSNNVNRPTLG
jgi:hypothetical protein